jgi:hypothetical protein
MVEKKLTKKENEKLLSKFEEQHEYIIDTEEIVEGNDVEIKISDIIEEK